MFIILYPNVNIRSLTQDLRLLGKLSHGINAHDPTIDIHPDILNRYYGVNGHRIIRGLAQTGAGQPEDEDAEEHWVDEEEEDNVDNESESEMDVDTEEYLQDCIAEDQAKNIRHPAVKVARHANPFEFQTDEDRFFAALDEVRMHRLIPQDYGVLECEWEDETYPVMETINPGTRGKQIIVELPKAIWLPHAVLFVQGLDVMTRLTTDMDSQAP
jgi:hypothetical protein